MIEHDELIVTPNIKDPATSTLYYRTSVKVARDNYCDTLMEFLSDVNFINTPSFKEREKTLDRQLESLIYLCKNAFYEKYRNNRNE